MQRIKKSAEQPTLSADQSKSPTTGQGEKKSAGLGGKATDKKEEGFTVSSPTAIRLQDFFEDKSTPVQLALCDPTMVTKTTMVAGYAVDEKPHVGVFDLQNRKHVCNLDFGDEPFIVDESKDKAQMQVVPLPGRDDYYYFGVVYQDQHRNAVLKIWPRDDKDCFNTFELAAWQDLNAITANQDSVFFQKDLFIVSQDCFGSGNNFTPCASIPAATRMHNLMHIRNSQLLAAVIGDQIRLYHTGKGNLTSFCKIDGSAAADKWLSLSPNQRHLCMYTEQQIGMYRISHSTNKLIPLPTTIFDKDIRVQQVEWLDASHLLVLLQENGINQLKLFTVQNDTVSFTQNLCQFESVPRILLSEDGITACCADGMMMGYKLLNRDHLKTLATTIHTSLGGTLYPGICQIIAESAYDLLTFSPARDASPPPVPDQNNDKKNNNSA